MPLRLLPANNNFSETYSDNLRLPNAGGASGESSSRIFFAVKISIIFSEAFFLVLTPASSLDLSQFDLLVFFSMADEGF